jgi:hypothetical protein
LKCDWRGIRNHVTTSDIEVLQQSGVGWELPSGLSSDRIVEVGVSACCIFEGLQKLILVDKRRIRLESRKITTNPKMKKKKKTA